MFVKCDIEIASFKVNTFTISIDYLKNFKRLFLFYKLFPSI